MNQRFLLSFLIFLAVEAGCLAQQVPSPAQHFGFTPGDNYMLANYTQTEAYFKKVAETSDRARLVNMGETEEGRMQYMMVISSPANCKELERYKAVAQKLARAENLSDSEARSLAANGKAVVWIDGGLHATETVGTHQLIETVWQLVSRTDAETMNILDNVVVLVAHANPDGQELVSNWYMRNPDSLKRSFSNLPRLYEKYAGHDNNRDFYMMNLKESQNISRQLYLEWMPQVVYNHHQAGPAGSVVAGPPYRDPFNYLINPLVITGIDAMGAAMVSRLNREGKPGYTQRGGAVFSTWYNGGLRTASYFHNMIGLLTEIIGSPTPSAVPLVPSRLLPNGNTPFPVTPQKWNFRKSIDYSVSLNYAILDYAARNREHLLYNIYCMGNASIEAGSKDTRSISPRRVEAIVQAYASDQNKNKMKDSASATGRASTDTLPQKYYRSTLDDPQLRDPRGYILPSGQVDFPSAVKLVNALIRSGIRVHKATTAFSVAGVSYPEGSYVIKTNQAFRPHILDMFEPQDHPNDFLFPGGPPVKPYDIAGWTPAFTMGIRFARILDGFDGPFEAIPYGELQTAPGILPTDAAAGYVLDPGCTNSFLAVNDLLHAGLALYRIGKQQGGKETYSQGSFFVPQGKKARQLLENAAREHGLKVLSAGKRPAPLTGKIAPLRIGLWDMYGGSMPAGWMRWIMEQHHFNFSRVYAKEINAGNLKEKFDVLLFVSGAIPPVTTARTRPSDDSDKPKDIPSEYLSQLGRISADTSIVELRKFMEAGGEVITIGRSTALAYHLKLPVKSALNEVVKGESVPLSFDKYFIPGSVLRVKINTGQPSGWGMAPEADVFFDSSPVFTLAPEAAVAGKVIPLAWFGTGNPLRSGWAFGPEYLKEGVAAFEAKVGSGKLYAFGPEIAFRAQTYGTFRMMFNLLYSGD